MSVSTPNKTEIPITEKYPEKNVEKNASRKKEKKNEHGKAKRWEKETVVLWKMYTEKKELEKR